MAGEYEDDMDGNSTWEEGDWNGDGDFSSADLVLAFTEGNYSREALPARAAIGEWKASHRPSRETIAVNDIDVLWAEWKKPVRLLHE